MIYVHSQNIEADDSQHNTCKNGQISLLPLTSKILDEEIMLLLSRKFAELLLLAAKFLAKLVCGKLQQQKGLGHSSFQKLFNMQGAFLI
jgi:hypothetical protein